MSLTVAKELRIDLGTLRPPKRRANGTLLVEGVLTRSGVFTYRDAQGRERREYRPPEEVFRADSMGSFHLVPLTNDHPPELVTAQNAKRYSVGAVGQPRRDGSFMVAPISVFDAEAVAAVESGKVELSNGYMVEVVDEPGVSPEGERYDAIQRNIEGNHVALVDVARAGPEARIRMDGNVVIAVMVSDAPTRVETRIDAQGANTMKVRIDGVEYDVSEQVAQAISKQDAAHKEALNAEKKRADEAEAKFAAEKVRADALKAELEAERAARRDAEDPSKLAARVDARVALVDTARAILGNDLDFGKMTDHEIRIAVIEKVDGNFESDLESVPEAVRDVYVRGRFDAAAGRALRSDASLDQLRSLARDKTHEDGASKRDKAYREYVDHIRNAWKAEVK